MRYLALALFAFVLVSCNRDPNYVKQKYLESGNKYFAAGRLHEASIMYRKAIDKDRLFGEGYYHLALTDLKQGSVMASVPALRRAVELLKPGTPDADDASLKLAEILIVAARNLENNEQTVKDVQSIADGLLKRNPNSWEGHKLTGDLAILAAAAKLKLNQVGETKKSIDTAAMEYRKALVSKPGDYVISLALGRTLVMEGEIGEAESIFKSLIARDGRNSNGYYQLYRVYIAQRRLADAESVLRDAVKNNGKDPALRLLLAQFYFSTNRKDELTSQLDQMKNDMKEFPDAYMQAGDFYLRLAQFDEAVKQYEEGIQKDPKRKNTYLKHEIEAYIRQNRMPQAIAKNEEILKGDARDPEARGLKATFLLNKGDKADVNRAMTELQSVVTAKPANFVAHFNLGRAHFAQGEYEQARQELERSVELRPDYLPARLALTQVALLSGENEAAIHQADGLLKYSPNSIPGRVMKAGALQRLQKYDEARALLNGILANVPTQLESLLELGILDLNQKKNKEAIEVFKKAYETNPGDSRGLLGESNALLLDGQPEKSVELIRVEAQKHPERNDILRALGNAQMSASQFDNAIASFRILLGKLPDGPQRGDVWARIAQAYRSKGDAEHAVEALQKSQERLPENAFISTDLAMLYDEMGKKDAARKYYETALRLDQNDPRALNNLAYLITETNGDLDLALTYATRAKQRMPDFAEITDTLGWIYLKKNLTDSAIDNFRTLVVKAPQNPIYHYHYAMALNMKGDRDGARKECQAALADRPSKTQESEIRQLMTKIG